MKVFQNTCHDGTVLVDAISTQWLRGRVSFSRLREHRFESYGVVLHREQVLYTLHCSSSLSCINEYLAIDSGGYLY